MAHQVSGPFLDLILPSCRFALKGAGEEGLLQLAWFADEAAGISQMFTMLWIEGRMETN